MISKDKKYTTRDGREVRIYATDGAHGKVHGAMLTAEGWEHRTWGSSGRIMLCEPHEYDLIEVRPRIKRTVWLNVCEHVVMGSYENKWEADSCAGKDRIACIKVDLDFCEGDGL